LAASRLLELVLFGSDIASSCGWELVRDAASCGGMLWKRDRSKWAATREVGPNKTGAKGSITVYRITGSSPAAG
jgi:hypothetical protein